MDWRLREIYQSRGFASLDEIWGDFIIYRRLEAADRRLPRLRELRPLLDLKDGPLPRKADMEYGCCVAELLRRARKLDLPGRALKRLIYIGDTRLNDGTAFLNICAAGKWPGWAFIGQEEISEPFQVQIQGRLYGSNRWSGLDDFERHLLGQDFGLDESTAVVIDMDKTAIGAKGRNDQVIDRVRLESIRQTLADRLGSDFDQRTFEAAYRRLKQPVFHPFTADNQDYLAYVCLILGAGLVRPEEVEAEVRAGTMRAFSDFFRHMEGLRAELCRAGLGSLHDAVGRCLEEGDPTAFKDFRAREYLATAARFGGSADAPLEQTLQEHIVMTAEVRDIAERLRQQGALVFGLSDKPDEASLPRPEQAASGMKPLHQLKTLVVGAHNVL